MTNASLSPSSGVRRRLVPLLAAVAVLAVLIGGGYAFRGSSSDGSGGGPPPVLRLADYQEPAADDAVDNQFRLEADLPGGPTDAAVRWLTAPEPADVERLAKALGIRGHLVRGNGTTTYTSDTASLQVQQGAGGQWQYARAVSTGGTAGCPPELTTPTEATNPDLSMSCDVAVPAPPSDEPKSSTPAPTDLGASKSLAITTSDGARKAARPVLEAEGIDPAGAEVRATRPVGVVLADPTVDGLATNGLTTTVTVSGERVGSATGWLGGTRAGATYPVLSARAAWQQVARTPLARPMIGCPEPLPADRDPMICGGSITVTGARFGLSVHQENGRPLLVPSWLFDVRGSESPLSVVAIAPRYLAAPPVPTASDDEPGSSGSGSGGSTGNVVPPVAPSAKPGAPTPASPPDATSDSRFSSVTADASGTELVVAFTGGVRACFSYTVVPTETERRVSLSLVEKVSSRARCVEMAQVYERRVPLAQALGTRQVIDARTGAVLLGPSR